VPNVEIAIGAGRTPEQIRAMIHEVHLAVLRTIDTAPQNIRVLVREVPRNHWATGDLTLAEWDAQKEEQS
jgi:4-oxalocrotonate tautomerase